MSRNWKEEEISMKSELGEKKGEEGGGNSAALARLIEKSRRVVEARYPEQDNNGRFKGHRWTQK